MATVAIVATGLATAVWLPTRFDEAAATENDAALTQVFADEFDGARGDAADAQKWSTDGRAVRLDGEGHLIITARGDDRGRTDEAGLQTLKTFSAQAGEVKARVKVADGQSVRSVFRLLGADTPDLDVMANSGDKSAVVRGKLGDDVNGSVDAGKSLAEDFHDYGLIFTLDGDIIWTFDGNEFVRTKRDLAEPFAVSLELSAPATERRRTRGSNDQSRGTSMAVDFVRVSVAKEKAEEPPPPAEETTPPTTPPTTEPTKPPAAEPPAAAAWAPFQALAAGDLVTFGGKTYKVKEDHTSLPGWEPPALTPDLFTLVS